MNRCIFTLAAALFLCQSGLHAQLEVNLSIKTRLYMAYEPIIAKVSITNLSGRDITLHDEGAAKWFGFQVRQGEDRVIGPRNPDYKLEELQIPAGQTLKRSVNLTALYPVTDFGAYRIQASVFFADINKYFSSPPCRIEVSEGKTIWQKTVGVPREMEGGGSSRDISLLTFRHPRENVLYVRIIDHAEGYVYVASPLGRIIAGEDPEVLLDRRNQLHVLHNCGPKIYLYSRIRIDGEIMGQSVFTAAKSRPRLRKMEDGDVSVLGGQEEAPASPTGSPSSSPVPKLSDRPQGMPLQ